MSCLHLHRICEFITVVVVVIFFAQNNGISKIHVVFNYILSSRSQLKNQLSNIPFNVCHKYSIFLHKKSYIAVPRTDPDINVIAYTAHSYIDLNISFRPIAQQINQV